ncbi:hypothetical protein PHLGIDRAFT_121273 [Phlebiopsis gigantea 11061_1 CR5-6]|uniref:Uncharacterized protein n=1 Tax=Phlebiopsis gigantea (strain 11061_1 CR5-6) TaxID=745531 RepID=A0A0C3S2F3_PHLG1|nr:hypothetical protein PHLGIDRAFT_121273 [Phlebiopsis gigantea 11061_1 CR5-6]
MEHPPSASNDEYHNFLAYDNLPGILIPQKVYMDPTLRQKPEPKDVRTFATFYRHETRGATLSAGPRATLGVSLAEALAFDPVVMKQARDIPDLALASLEDRTLKFILEWPGCTPYLSAYTRYGRERCVWSAARIAYEVARAVRCFYDKFEKHISRCSPTDDWTPNRIPFDKLYLLELRQSNDEYHSFLSYDNLPGILIPQSVYLGTNQEPKDVRTFATFYRHQTLGATISAEPGATLGVSLAEALAFDSDVMKQARHSRDPALAHLHDLTIKFILAWPGCIYYVPRYTGRCAWTAARISYEVARAVHGFYEAYEQHVSVNIPTDDWGPEQVPFNKLYLLELRQISERVFQPVLYYDAHQ